ncbi:MAG: hypothetical protein ABI747_00510 [Candidatus Moraniibacteriota bacterium]
MLKLIFVPALFVAVVVGVIAGLQYMSGDRAEAIRTAEGGVALVAKTIQAVLIGVVITEVLFVGAFIYFLKS